VAAAVVGLLCATATVLGCLAAGTLIGAVGGGFGSAIQTSIDGGSNDEVWQALIDGAVSGFIAGLVGGLAVNVISKIVKART
jgi:hypothetical protein